MRLKNNLLIEVTRITDYLLTRRLSYGYKVSGSEEVLLYAQR